MQSGEAPQFIQTFSRIIQACPAQSQAATLFLKKGTFSRNYEKKWTSSIKIGLFWMFDQQALVSKHAKFEQDSPDFGGGKKKVDPNANGVEIGRKCAEYTEACCKGTYMCMSPVSVFW